MPCIIYSLYVSEAGFIFCLGEFLGFGLGVFFGIYFVLGIWKFN